MKRVLTVAIAAIILSTGVAQAKRPLTADQIAQFKPGVATKDDVVKGLGDPTESATNSDGQTMMTYDASRVNVNAGTFIPYVNLFTSGAKTHEQEVVFHFGSDGILTGVDSHSRNVNCSIGVFATRC